MRAQAQKRSRSYKALLVAIVSIATMWSGAARAEGGELFLRLTIANEAALLHHPGVTYRSGGSWVYVPRFGLAATYGISHWFNLGAGGEVSPTRDILAHDVAVQGLPPGTLNARYLAVLVPVRLGIHVTQGSDWSGEFVASGGPAFSRWSADESRSSSGLLLPMEPFEGWYTEWFGRLTVLAEWRPANWGAISFGTYVGASTTRDISVGLMVEGSLVAGVGPFLKAE